MLLEQKLLSLINILSFKYCNALLLSKCSQSQEAVQDAMNILSKDREREVADSTAFLHLESC